MGISRVDPRVWRVSPSGSGLGEVAGVRQRSEAFSAAVRATGRSVSLVVSRSGGVQSSFLVIPPVGSGEKLATYLGNAMGGSITPVAVAEVAGQLGGTRSVRELIFARSLGVGTASVANLDVADPARVLSGALRDGQWVVFSLRSQSRTERKRWGKWLPAQKSEGVGAHHSLTTDAVVMSVVAGGEDRSDVDGLLEQVRAALPGFDIQTRSRSVWSRLPWVLGLLSAALAGVGFLLGWRSIGQAWCTAGAVVVMGVAVCIARGWLPSRSSRMVRGVECGLFPAPPRRRWWLWWRKPRGEKQREDGSTEAAFAGDYPLGTGSFLVGPWLPIMVAAPYGGAVSGHVETAHRPAPAVLGSRIGPFIGEDDVGSRVFLSAADLFGGVALLGRMGSGKTQLLQGGLYGWTCLDRVSPSGLPGSLGASQSVVAFESKGEGALEYLRFAQMTGDSTTFLVETADPLGVGIDLLPGPGAWVDRGRFFADMLRYVLADQSIGPESFRALSSLGAAALALLESEEGREVLDGEGLSGVGLMGLLYALLGGRGDEFAVNLDLAVRAAAVRAEGLGTRSEALACAEESLRPYYAGAPPSSRRDRLAPPSNKIFALMESEHWWTGAKQRVTWDEILENHWSVVVNTGPSVVRDGVMLDATVSDQMAGMLMFSLQRAIMRRCSSWSQFGRGVSIFSDELSILAGTDPGVVTWLHDQGRSFGVRTVFATQRAGQLDAQVRASLMDCDTLIAFRQGGADGAEPIVEDLCADGSAWSVADLVSLPPYTAAVRTSVHQQRQVPFTMKAHYFTEDSSDYSRIQGWSS